VAESVDTLIACGEQEATEWGFRHLIERAKVDVLQPDLTRCGGFTAARKIVHMAELSNVLVILILVDGLAYGGITPLERISATAASSCESTNVPSPSKGSFKSGM